MKHTELNLVFNLLQVREASFNYSVEDFSIPDDVAVGKNRIIKNTLKNNNNNGRCAEQRRARLSELHIPKQPSSVSYLLLSYPRPILFCLKGYRCAFRRYSRFRFRAPQCSGRGKIVEVTKWAYW
jgi:hypothetical protein